MHYRQSEIFALSDGPGVSSGVMMVLVLRQDLCRNRVPWLTRLTGGGSTALPDKSTIRTVFNVPIEITITLLCLL